MSERLADLAEAARHEQFVGRGDVLARFDAALSGRGGPRLLFLHGVGGIGKSTLLQELRRHAATAGRPTLVLDGSDGQATPQAWQAAVGSRRHPELALFVDCFEALQPHDEWFWAQLVPQLPSQGVAVLAGRDPPTGPLLRQPAWRSVLWAHRLPPLSAAESDVLLSRLGVAPVARAGLTGLAHGHPLALALLADATASGAVPASIGDAPDLVTALVEAVVSEVPSPAHGTGLAMCSMVWCLTEDVLRRELPDAAAAVWTWLRRRPYVALSARGLVLHELTREVVAAEMERRSPETFRALHHRVHAAVVAQVRGSTGTDRQHAMQQLLHLHRHAPFTAPLAGVRQGRPTPVLPATARDVAGAAALVRRFEGPASGELATRWMSENPTGLSVVTGDDRLLGFAFRVLLPTGSALDEEDPVTRAVLDRIDTIAPLRPGERVHLGRFVGGPDGYQRDPYALLAASVSSTLDWLTEPAAWALVVTVDPDHWAPLLDYLALDFLVQVQPPGLPCTTAYGIDWRRFGVEAWLELMHERESSGQTGPVPPRRRSAPPLTREQFTDAVRTALRDLHDEDRLSRNPLTSTRLGPAADTLRRAVVRAVAELESRPRDGLSARVLARTFVRPAATQEAAAAALHLPFSTYRRHLARATAQLTDLLWAREVQAGPASPVPQPLEQRTGAGPRSAAPSTPPEDVPHP